MRPSVLRHPATIAIVVASCVSGIAAAGAAMPEDSPGGGARSDSSAAGIPLADAPDSASVARAPADTAAKPSLTARARRTVGNFLSDGWYVLSSPARVHGAGLVWMGVIVGTTAIIYANDQELLDAVIRNREAPVLRTVLDVGDAIEPIGFMQRTNPYYFGAMVAGYVFDVRLLRTIPAEILESHLIAGVLRNVAKGVVGRRHPSEDRGPYDFTFAGGTSFPSGHTSVAFELATIASLNARSLPVTIAAYSLATSMAFQRIDSLNHWPTDVFVAGVYGILVARAVVQRNEDREHGRGGGVSILPRFSDDGRWVGVRFARRF